MNITTNHQRSLYSSRVGTAQLRRPTRPTLSQGSNDSVGLTQALDGERVSKAGAGVKAAYAVGMAALVGGAIAFPEYRGLLGMGALLGAAGACAVSSERRGVRPPVQLGDAISRATEALHEDAIRGRYENNSELGEAHVQLRRASEGRRMLDISEDYRVYSNQRSIHGSGGSFAPILGLAMGVGVGAAANMLAPASIPMVGVATLLGGAVGGVALGALSEHKAQVSYRQQYEAEKQQLDINLAAAQQQVAELEKAQA